MTNKTLCGILAAISLSLGGCRFCADVYQGMVIEQEERVRKEQAEMRKQLNSFYDDVCSALKLKYEKDNKKEPKRIGF